MAIEDRTKLIKELVAKFTELVESLQPGERLAIRKLNAPKERSASKPRNRAAAAAKSKPASKARAGKRTPGKRGAGKQH